MTIDLKAALGIRVRAARENCGMSQERLAEVIGRTPETISNIERGKTMPNTDTIQALCSALGVDWLDLLSKPEEEMASDRIKSEFRIVQMVRALPHEDLVIVETTVEALYKRAELSGLVRPKA